MTDVALFDVVYVAAFLAVAAVADALVLLALSAGYDRLGWSPRGLALAGGGFVLLGQAVLVVWALRAWGLLWLAGPESPARGPGWAPSEVGPAAAVQTAAPYILVVIGASAVMLIGASVIALAVWKASRRSSTTSPADVPSVTSDT